MIEMVQYEYIRFLYFNQNKSQRAIAREMGIHRETVKRAIMNPEQKYNFLNGTFNPHGINKRFHSTHLFCCFSRYHASINTVAQSFCM